MPFASKQQAKAMFAAASGHSNIGIPQSVGQDFVSASHGMSVKKLPMRVGKKTRAKAPPKPRIFGSLAPHDNGHEMGVTSGDYAE